MHEMLELSRKTRRHSDTYLSHGVFSFYVAEMKYSEKIARCNARRKISCSSPSLRKACRSSSQHSYYDGKMRCSRESLNVFVLLS
ncbi:hypothetical protein BIW11_06174 [Tropilaelaps mercedesae]|uniref:Uncharacterized protein n=1 Tax=Tropilaelaps mercedesae TaxID=418985 RepID=A0A1V9XZA3_9ACAR|nr:hypothetical protein BIW11_06174 [Tropilaelaps mercedesae]